MKKFFKNSVRFCSKRTYFIIVINIVFLIIFIFSFYNIARNKALSVLIDQTYRKEELAISSGVKSIQIFLEMTGDSLLLLSRDSSIINQDANIQESLDNFILDWIDTPVVAVVRGDKNGKLNFMGNNVDISQSSEIVKGLFIDNKDYFNWAKTAAKGDIFLGKPQPARVEMSSLSFFLPMATPIYKNGEFDGVLVLAISLSKLTMTYLEPLEVSPDYRVYLIHSDGTILVGPSDQLGLVGLNYSEYLYDNPYPGSEEAAEAFSKAVANKDKDRLDLVLYSTTKKKPDRFIMAHSPLIFHDNHWTLGIAVPFDDVRADFDPLRETSIILLFLVTTFTLVLSIVGILFVRVNQRRFYAQGLKDGKKTES